MSEFVQLWVYLSSSPLFGLNATLVVYLIALAFYNRMDQAPWANPVLWSMLTLGAALTVTGTAYPTYFAGAQFIHFLLGPAVVALAWPLWQRRVQLRAGWVRFVAASIVGGGAAAASAVGLGWALDLPADLIASLAPKSVTAPVAMGITAQIGGIPPLAAVLAVITGLVGALSGKYLFACIRIGTDSAGWTARGFAMGTAAHGIGAARSMQVNADAGAWAALALGLQVLTASLLIPLLWK
jgi:putative effector of murein hydrolase